jgi:hypothetical protein
LGLLEQRQERERFSGTVPPRHVPRYHYKGRKISSPKHASQIKADLID